MPKSGSKTGNGVETPIIGHEYAYVYSMSMNRHWIVVGESGCACGAIYPAVEHRHYNLRAVDEPWDVVDDYLWPKLPNPWVPVEDEFDKFVREIRENGPTYENCD